MAEANRATLRILETQSYQNDRLRVQFAGLDWENPVGVGPGWTKSGEAILGLYTLGFGSVEVGAVLEHPQKGNPKKRQFVARGKNNELVARNSLGFNTPKKGMDDVENQLYKYFPHLIPTGINLGINKEVEQPNAKYAYSAVIRRLHRFASWFSLNVSSPNTKGLKDNQMKGPLTDIVQMCIGTMVEMKHKVPFFVKVSPDLTNDQLSDVIEVCIKNKVSGIIATNTTIDENIKKKYGWEGKAGGVSGDDYEYFNKSVRVSRIIYQETKGALPTIGAGAVNSGKRALARIENGDSALQIVTGLRGEGPGVAGKINRELIELMDERGYENITKARGAALKH